MKLRCNITQNIIYMTKKRYTKLLAKYNGDEEALRSNYISLRGKKVRDGIIEMPEKITNRIKCSVTGHWCYITNARIAAGIAKYGSWETLCANYKSRVTKRLLKSGKTEDEIKQMVVDGTYPSSHKCKGIL